MNSQGVIRNEPHFSMSKTITNGFFLQDVLFLEVNVP